MTAGNGRDSHIDVLEFISFGASVGGEARAALEMFLLHTRSTSVPELEAESNGTEPWRGDKETDRRQYS